MTKDGARVAQPTRDLDAVALARVAAGDPAAMGEVYERHVRAIHRFACRTVGADAADDLVQLTFMRAADLAGRYDPRLGTTRAWLHGVAVQVMRERRRSLARWAQALLRFADTQTETSYRPEGSRTDLERALAKLSEPKRIVLVLAEVEGYSGPEIAHMLGVPVGTVWTRLHHARRELRVMLGEGPP